MQEQQDHPFLGLPQSWPLAASWALVVGLQVACWPVGARAYSVEVFDAREPLSASPCCLLGTACALGCLQKSIPMLGLQDDLALAF